MRAIIHPDLRPTAVRCSTCGHAFELRSTRDTLEVDTCRICHPAYTGRPRAIGQSGRVERFRRRQSLAHA